MDNKVAFAITVRRGLLPPTARVPIPLLNSRVAHPAWGEDRVLHYEGDKMFVLFDEVSYTKL